MVSGFGLILHLSQGCRWLVLLVDPLADSIASFYRGYEPMDLKAMEGLFQGNRGSLPGMCHRRFAGYGMARVGSHSHSYGRDLRARAAAGVKHIFETYSSTRGTTVHPSRMGESLGSEAIPLVLLCPGFPEAQSPVVRKARQEVNKFTKLLLVAATLCAGYQFL
jgi:hypothetical protein